MLIDVLPTLSNTIMYHKHFSRLMAKSMNELAHKSPLIRHWSIYIFRVNTILSRNHSLCSTFGYKHFLVLNLLSQ